VKTNSQFQASIKPTTVTAGHKIVTTASFRGVAKNAFFDNMIVDPNGNVFAWNPDPDTWNLYKDTGTLQGEGRFESRWTWFVPPWAPLGEYRIFVRLYEDPNGTLLGRRSVHEEVLNIQVLESDDSKVHFLRRIYSDILEREPDIPGLADWYNAMQKLGLSKGTVIERGFIISPEFLIIQGYKILSGGARPNQENYDRWYSEILNGQRSLNSVFEEMLSMPDCRTTAEYTLKEFYGLIKSTFFEGRLKDSKIEDLLQQAKESEKTKGVILSEMFANPIFQKFQILLRLCKELDRAEFFRLLKRYQQGEISLDQILEDHKY